MVGLAFGGEPPPQDPRPTHSSPPS
jgi:hypothetical protein